MLGSTNFHNLTAGDWETSTVNFYGTNTINNIFESVFTTNVYGTLNANQVISDNDFAFLNVYDGGTVTFSSFQQGAPVHVYDGTFTVTDLLEDYFKGSYTIDDGLINLGQTYSPTASHDLYYASITINGGELWFTGGNGQTIWPRSPGTASLTMTSGALDMKNREVFITTGNFTENISGGVIRVNLGFGADLGCQALIPPEALWNFMGSTTVASGCPNHSAGFITSGTIRRMEQPLFQP